MNSRAVLGKALRLNIFAMLLLAIVGGVAGYFWLGVPGLLSFIIGAVITLIFSGVTIVSIMVAGKFDIALFFGVVLGSWLLKLIIFIVILALIRDQPFIDNVALFIALVVAIAVNLGIDSFAVLSSRMPYVTNLPADSSQAEEDGSAAK